MNPLDNYRVNKVLVIVIVIFAYQVRVAHISLPLLNAHYFRQTQTATVAKNFYTDGIDLLHPRLDVFGIEDKGILVLEFPLYQAIVALAYKIFGLHDYVGRMIAVLWSIVAGVCLYKTVLLITRNQLWATATLLFFLFAPVNIFFNQAYMLESTVVALHILSFYLWIRFFRTQSNPLYLLVIVLTSLAFITKSIYVSVIIANLIAYWFIFERTKHAINSYFFAGLLISVMVLFAWQRYADNTNTVNGHTYFVSTGSGQLLWNIGTLRERLSLNIWKLRIYDVFAALSKPFIVTVLMGCAIALKKIYSKSLNIDRNYAYYCLLITGISVGYYLLFFRIQSHVYYLSPVIPLLSIVAGYGIYQGNENIKHTAIKTISVSKNVNILKIIVNGLTFLILFMYTVKSVSNAQPYFTIDEMMYDKLFNIRLVMDKHSPAIIVLTESDWNSVYPYYLGRKVQIIAIRELTETNVDIFRTNGYRYIVVDGLKVLVGESIENKVLKEIRKLFDSDKTRVYDLQSV